MNLSIEMMRAITQARLNGHELVRLPGGFWTDTIHARLWHRGYGNRPEWSVNTHTIKALERRGRMVVDWRGGKAVLQ